jgi:hypothetical protein
LRRLAEEGVVRTERRALRAGGTITLYWQRSFRYYKRTATRLVNLVDEYADPNIGGALGLHGESMVLEGFARSKFVMHGREVREHAGRLWEESMHDVDFVFERDGVAYGIEVKNTLGYPPQDEILLKTEMSRHLGLRPVIVARMLPRPWIEVLRRSGGFGLILKYQLYPWTHRELARRVATETGLELNVDELTELRRELVERSVPTRETWWGTTRSRSTIPTAMSCLSRLKAIALRPGPDT